MWPHLTITILVLLLSVETAECAHIKHSDCQSVNVEYRLLWDMYQYDRVIRLAGPSQLGILLYIVPSAYIHSQLHKGMYTTVQ